MSRRDGSAFAKSIDIDRGAQLPDKAFKGINSFLSFVLAAGQTLSGLLGL